MSASTLPADTPVEQSARRSRPPGRRAGRIALWVLGLPAAIVLLLYLVLLITPIRLPFAGGAVRALVQGALPASSQLELGEMALALEGGV